MSIRKKVISGLKWTTIGTIGRALFQLLQVSILTRFLPKEAFGLVAMALFVVNFSNIFVDMGMSSAILHRQNATKKEYSSIYWLNIFISFLLYCFIFLGAPLVARFYNEPELRVLVPVLGLNLLLMATGQQHRTIMQKEFQFRTIAITEMVSFFLGLITAITLALNNFGVYSLVYSTLLASLVSNILFLILNLRSNPIQFYFRLKETKPFLKIGSFTMGSTVLNFFSSEIDILIVGRMLGAESLGLYSLSKQIVMKLYTIVNPIVISVLNPVLASIQKEKEKVKNYYLRVVYLLASINFPIYFLIVILSKEILAILYGNNYVMGYAILSFLAIAFCTNTIGNPVGSLYIATGRTDIGFKWTIFRVAITPVIIFFASRINVNAVAIAMAGITIILIVPAWWVQLKPMANIQLKEYLSQFYKPYLLLLLLSGIYLVGSQFFQLSFGIIPNVLVKGSVAFIIFLSILLIVDKKRFIDIITIIKSRHE